jgi:hypothetical protein
MGSYGSGRSGGRPTVQGSLTLDLRRLFKMGLLMTSARTFGELRWTWGGGRKIASMWCQSDLGKDSGYVRLYWNSANPRTGETCQCENRIALTTKAQPFGGRRWFFVCPRTGRTATKLHLPSGASTFACRVERARRYLGRQTLARRFMSLMALPLPGLRSAACAEPLSLDKQTEKTQTPLRDGATGRPPPSCVVPG